MAKINDWLISNKLILNKEKSNDLLLNLSGRQCRDFEIKIGCSLIKRVVETKILGIVFDERLSFKNHINIMCDKISNKVNFLARIRYVLPKKSLNIIYKSLVMPIMDYGICVYGFTYDSHLQRIIKLQNRAVKVISFCGREYSVLFRELNWIPFIQRRNYLSCIIMSCMSCIINV